MAETASSQGSPETWLRDYEASVQLKGDIVQLIQDRNSKYQNGGPDASRLTATARRKLGSLKTGLDKLQTLLESDSCSSLSENEKNRRRGLLLALRNERDGIIQSLKRPVGHRQYTSSGSMSGFETDATAEKNNAQLLAMQTALMQEQDEALEHLERSTVTTKNIAIQINDETRLQNRLLEEFDGEVEQTSDRLQLAQRKLKMVMQRAGGCTGPLLLFVLIVILLVLLVIALKIL